jgi:hypothetical protein
VTRFFLGGAPNNPTNSRRLIAPRSNGARFHEQLRERLGITDKQRVDQDQKNSFLLLNDGVKCSFKCRWRTHLNKSKLQARRFGRSFCCINLKRLEGDIGRIKHGRHIRIVRGDQLQQF